MTFQPPKGTDDVIAPESARWRASLVSWEAWAARFGYQLVMTPVLETTELFERGVGETTEIVTKQMYTFTDRGGRSLTLRPEGTAGVVRAFLNSGLRGPWKAAYSGPMFRYERPQAGRRRQFWQVGAEYLDVDSPSADVEVIELGFRYLVELGVPGLELRLNSLGDAKCRPAYLEALRQFLDGRRASLCDDSRSLIETNPLRVLDCKVCAPVLEDAPAMLDWLCDDCSAHHQAVIAGLASLGISQIIDPRLVRGLDYYTRTAWEYVATGLEAAQNSVGGGGRYDGLAEALGGRPAPGVGFALGIERVILATGGEPAPVLDVYVVSEIGPAPALGFVSRLRGRGLRVDFDTEGRSVKAQFRAATRSGAPFTVIVGEGDRVEVRTVGERVGLSTEEAGVWIESRLE